MDSGRNIYWQNTMIVVLLGKIHNRTNILGGNGGFRMVEGEDVIKEVYELLSLFSRMYM